MAYTTIDDPSAHFQVATWTGSASTDTITFDGNSDLQLDFLWTKCRSNGHSNAWMDTSRITSGDYLPLFSDTTDVEQTSYDSELQSILSDGFTVGTQPHAGGDGKTYVGMAWKANGGTVANDTNGDITTSVQANTTAGFSIATYTGNGGSNQTLGHGLGAEPELVIFKDRDSSSAWRIFVKSLGASKFLNLDTGDAANTSSNIFPSHSSTTIGVEQNDVMNKNSSKHIMYSFRSIQGYSKIGQYVGNSNADGVFVYTGFKPAWLMIKNISATQSWWYFDNKRQGYNGGDVRLRADRDTTESTGSKVDFVSNGFKWRDGDNAWNYSGNDFIYIAIAEHPFVSSEGVPVTAR